MKEIYQSEIEEIYKEFKTSDKGLKSREAKKLLKVNGKNVLKEKDKPTKLQLFLKQFKNVMIILLLIVGILSLINAIITKGDFLEPIVILGTGFINCFMGYLQESKAADALEKLKKYSLNYVTVKRDNKYKKINSKHLVVGDYIILESGDKIPADARIIKEYFAMTDESLLTGESATVSKESTVIKNSVSLAERKNMLYSGTILVFGKAEAIVTATGMETELGKIAQSLEETEEVLTPLQIKIQKVSKLISYIAAFLVIFVLVFGLINHYDFLSIIMLGISMIVASVPESLPIAITATLTIGVKQMAKKKTIVRNLAAIETLGATNIICTDKTGTLTENKMRVIKVYVPLKNILAKDLQDNSKLVEIMSLCNNAILGNNKKYTGDAADVALKEYLSKNKIAEFKYQKLGEIPFDSNRKMMSVAYSNKEEVILYTKGSLETILKRVKKVLIDSMEVTLTDELKNNFKKAEKEMAHESLKVIALAYKKLSKKDLKEEEYMAEENNLVLVGLVGLKDPVRNNVKEAIQMCKEAGIKPIMLTGDNKETAFGVAKEVGICDNEKECLNAHLLDKLSDEELKEYINKYKVFSRVSPEHKLRIVKALQDLGNVVAMSGDGVNDAPALKLAHAGIGMGKSGTDVTKDVSDIILLDDSFNTIVTAIIEGRRIYDNVIANILYNLSSNLTEIIIILFGVFTGNTIITALHILYIDLVADTIPSITLAFEGPSKDIIKRKPNGLNKPIFTKYFLVFLILSVIIETSLGLFIFYRILPLGKEIAQTLTLLGIIINEFIFAYNCRSINEEIIKKGLFSNHYLNMGILFLLIVQIIVFFTPIGKIFGLASINLMEFVYVLLINIIAFILIELLKPILNKLFKDA